MHGNDTEMDEDLNMTTLNLPQYFIDPNVWSLYQELKVFYGELKKIYIENKKKLPPVYYANHYNKILKYWCDYQLYRYTNKQNGILFIKL